MRDAAVILSPSGAPIWMNRAAHELAECENSASFQLSKRIFVTPGEDLISTLVAEARRLKQAVLLPANTVITRSRGRYALLSGVITPILNDRGELRRCVLVMYDITERAEVQRAFEWQASHDLLTGLLTRQELERRIEDVLRADTAPQMPHALLLLEVEHLALINETCGHATGDALLQQFAQDLLGWARPNDVLSRVCGNQFALLLQGTDIALAQEVAAEILASMRRSAFTWEGREFHLAASVGIVAVAPLASAARWLSLAEIACTQARRHSHQPIHVYHQSDEARLLSRHREALIAANLPRLVREKRLLLYCQEIVAVDCRRDSAPRLDMSLRVRQPDGSMLMPQQLIASAQRYGLLPLLDRWLLASIVDAYRNAMLPPHGAIPLCYISISPTTLADAEFVAFVLQQLAQIDHPLGLLCFQLSELGDMLSAVQRNMESLRQAGVQFALEGFGSGAVALHHLKALPAQYVRIDGVVVRGLAHDVRDRTVATAISELSHANGMRVIANDVDNLEVLEILRRLHVDYAQGPALMSPQPLHHVDEALTHSLALPMHSMYELPLQPPGVLIP